MQRINNFVGKIRGTKKLHQATEAFFFVILYILKAVTKCRFENLHYETEANRR